MKRVWYIAGWGYVAIASTIVAKVIFPEPPVSMPPVAAAPTAPATDAATWFASVKPQCNALEVEVMLQQHPAPAGWEGAGYTATCLAMAGKTERSREAMHRIAENQRYAAAGIMFNVGHPIADAGDDRSAGPIMQMVAEFQPDNYMALYHAGMSYYATGHADLARNHLERFLRLYDVNDGWKTNAIRVLKQLEHEESE
jgi:hypothetical protein